MVARTDNGTGEFKTVGCLLNNVNVNVNLMIDLGAKVSLINYVIYNKCFSNIKLERSNVRLTSYDGTDIESLGCLYMSVQYESNSLPRFCVHASVEGKSIIGVDLFDALRFKAFDSVGKYITMVSSDVDPDKRATVQLANYPKLTRDFGYIKGYQHRPMIDSSAQPVRQGLRRLPLALRDEVSTELKRMLDMDLIEKIDTSPWISNLVLERKKDKTLRIFTNMTNVNRSIIPEYFPLATLEELTLQLAGAKFFSKLDLKWGYLQVSLAQEVDI